MSRNCCCSHSVQRLTQLIESTEVQTSPALCANVVYLEPEMARDSIDYEGVTMALQSILTIIGTFESALQALSHATGSGRNSL